MLRQGWRWSPRTRREGRSGMPARHAAVRSLAADPPAGEREGGGEIDRAERHMMRPASCWSAIASRPQRPADASYQG